MLSNILAIIKKHINVAILYFAFKVIFKSDQELWSSSFVLDAVDFLNPKIIDCFGA